MGAITIAGLTLATPWWWLIAGLILGIAELIAPGIFLIWIGAAAVLTGLLSLLLHLPIEAEFILFAVAAIASVLFGRKWIAEHPVISADPTLNDRAHRLIGRSVEVVEAITSSSGRVKVDDGVWLASGPETPVGMRVRVIGADGSRLIVEAEG